MAPRVLTFGGTGDEYIQWIHAAAGSRRL
jgi:hypothetical protein